MQETLRVGKISHYITINSDQSNSAEPLTAGANGKLDQGGGGARRLHGVWLAKRQRRAARCPAHAEAANQWWASGMLRVTPCLLWLGLGSVGVSGLF